MEARRKWHEKETGDFNADMQSFIEWRKDANSKELLKEKRSAAPISHLPPGVLDFFFEYFELKCVS